MTIEVLSLSTRMLLRSLLSLGSVELQTGQLQAIIGTPLLVPVPKNVICKDGQNMCKSGGKILKPGEVRKPLSRLLFLAH